jgi:phenylpropionate dioxygenase-like ring-hydroxylating dioxygenase large terminal subunit
VNAVVEPRPTVVHAAAPGSGRKITAERYVSESWLAREFESLWPQMWLFACLERDVAEPGAYRVFNVGRESILISRTQAGELAAFFNVCQHRGARVMVNDFGWVEKFVCPYHGWTYGYDGHLNFVPDVERFRNGIDQGARSLKPVRVETWAGLVWICMDEHAPPLMEFLGPAAERITPYRLDDMTLVADQTVHLDCNWKAVFDNFGELYHVDHIHPQHELMFNCPAAEIHLFDRGHTGVVIDGHTVNPRLPIPDEPNPYLTMQLEKFGGNPSDYHGRVLDIRLDIQKLRRDAGPRLGYDYDLMSDERLSDIEQYNFFPNTMITVQPEDALIVRARPHPTDPNRCYWDKFTLHMQPKKEIADRAGVAFEPFDPADVEPVPRPEHDEFTQEDIIAGRKTMTITIDQDIHLIRDVQAGMHSRGFESQELCDDEVRIQHYHDWLGHIIGNT